LTKTRPADRKGTTVKSAGWGPDVLFSLVKSEECDPAPRLSHRPPRESFTSSL
jgi:hypothetical protein